MSLSSVKNIIVSCDAENAWNYCKNSFPLTADTQNRQDSIAGVAICHFGELINIANHCELYHNNAVPINDKTLAADLICDVTENSFNYRPCESPAFGKFRAKLDNVRVFGFHPKEKGRVFCEYVVKHLPIGNPTLSLLVQLKKHNLLNRFKDFYAILVLECPVLDFCAWDLNFVSGRQEEEDFDVVSAAVRELGEETGCGCNYFDIGRLDMPHCKWEVFIMKFSGWQTIRIPEFEFTVRTRPKSSEMIDTEIVNKWITLL